MGKWFGAYYNHEVGFSSAVKCKKVLTSLVRQRQNYYYNNIQVVLTSIGFSLQDVGVVGCTRKTPPGDVAKFPVVVLFLALKYKWNLFWFAVISASIRINSKNGTHVKQKNVRMIPYGYWLSKLAQPMSLQVHSYIFD